MTSKGDVFDRIAAKQSESGSGDIFDRLASKKKKPQEPATLEGSLKAYGSGLVGGAGGLIPDVITMTKPLALTSETAAAANQLIERLGLKGTKELTSSISGEEPKNALERILQQSGEFGGQEGLMGAAVGGPAGAGIGAVHGSASGALYGGLKELGMDDNWAMGVTALATVSPVAIQRLWPKLMNKFKSGSSFKEAAESVFPGGMGGEPPPGGGMGDEIGSMINRASGKAGAEELAEKIAPGERVSPYRAGEKALEEVKPSGFESKPLGKTVEVPSGLTEGKSLKGRVTHGAETEIQKPLGTSEISFPKEQYPDIKTLEGRVSTPQKMAAREISPNAFKTDREAGVILRNTAQKIKEPLKKGFAEEFNKLKAETGNISGPQDGLAKAISDFIEENRGSLLSKEGPGAERKVLAAAEELLQKLQHNAPTGEFVGYKDVSVADLLKTKKSIGDIADFEIAESSFKGAYKHLYGEVDKAIENMLRNKAPKSFAKFENINRRYSGYKRTFENDNLKLLFEPQNLEYENAFKSLLNPDSIAAAERIFSHSKEGREVLNKLKRDYFLLKTSKGKLSEREANNLKEVLGDRFNKTIDQFTKEPPKVPVTRKEGGKDLKGRITQATQLVEKSKEGVRVHITPQRVKAYDDKLKKIADKVAAHAKRTPEDILKKLNTRSGIKELRKEFSENAVDSLVKSKAQSVLKGGKIKKDFKGGDIAEILNEEANYELFSELIGENETKAFYEMAEELKDQAITFDKMKKLGISSAKMAGAAKAFKIISALL